MCIQQGDFIIFFAYELKIKLKEQKYYELKNLYNLQIKQASHLTFLKGYREMNRKKSQSLDRRSHNLIGYEKLNKLKELGFTTSWNINQKKKEYNALEDPNADRYFKYQSVKLHMKELRKSLGRAEKNEGEKKKLAKLIKQKLSDHLPAIKVAASTYNIQAADLNKTQAVQHLSKQKSLKRLNKQKSLSEFAHHYRKNKHKKKKNDTQKFTNIDISIQPIVQQANGQRESQLDSKEYSENGKTRTQMNPVRKSEKSLRAEDKKQIERKEYMKKQQELLHKKRHEEFISYIAKKRETLESANR